MNLNRAKNGQKGWYNSHLRVKFISDQSLSWVLPAKREDAQDSDLTPFWGDLSQSEKLSDIKLPLFADIYSFTKRDLDKIEFCVAVLAEER